MKRLLLAAMACSQAASAQNLIDNYLSGTPTYTVIAGSSSQISQPRDLDFKPLTNELWLINQGNFNLGGSNVIIYNAGESNQSTQYRWDSHSQHFMNFPSGIAFGDDREFTTTHEIVNNINNPNSTFMGPALWSGDTAVFARVFQNNWVNGKPLGSHLDMLHQSPLSVGVAHDTGSMYWVADGHNGNLVKYDFGDDHSPGYDDHSNGRIWRYTDVTLSRTPNVPGHVVKDKTTGWVYFVDAGGKKLKRVNPATASITGTLNTPSSSPEPLIGYWAMTGATVEILDSFNTSQPCGIDVFNGRLIVGDHANGNIYVYDITGTTPVKLGTIATGQSGMMGVKIGYDGKIWFVNHTQNNVIRIDPATGLTDDVALVAITAPALTAYESNFYATGFSACGNTVAPVITIRNEGSNTLTTAMVTYRIDNGTPSTYTWTGSLAMGATASVSLPAVAVATGAHKLTVSVTNAMDANPANSTMAGSFRAFDATSAFPFTENFTNSAFPPAGWTSFGYNFHNQIAHIGSVGSFGSNSGAIWMDNYSGVDDISGQRDYLMTPRIDFTNANANAGLSFALAYAQYNASTNDALTVSVSTDCGQNWTQVYHKAGSVLATAVATTAAFTPGASDWRTEMIPLSAYAGQADVMFRFTTTSNYGNNVYIDDINLDNTASVAGTSAAGFTVYPNPTRGKVTIEAKDKLASGLSVSVYDMTGRLIKPAVDRQGGQLSVDLAGLPQGTYILRMTDGVHSRQEKITLVN